MSHLHEAIGDIREILHGLERESTDTVVLWHKLTPPQLIQVDQLLNRIEDMSNDN